MLKHLSVLILVILAYTSVQAQELKMDVKVNYAQQLKLADPSLLKQMETSISEFFNNNKWTDNNYENAEKIECNLLINIKEELGANSFQADFRIQSVRPVFNSNYNSQLLNYIDKNVRFGYQDFQPIENSSTTFVDNLSSILTFYAYAIIGFDQDTFSANGGDDSFKVAQNIVNNIPSSVSSGDVAWSALGSERNRYWLVENLLSPKSSEYREAMYEYHRQGIDLMSKDVDRGRLVIMNSINLVDRAYKAFPRSMIIQMFSDSKRDEIIEIFRVAEKAQKRRVYDIMVAIDPARADQYSPLKA